ncbi:MAG: cytochrome P450 [Flavobacteriales bacterium]|nr:MAG: cytochrome P450 [Flavobacteriales bacterium]
METNTKELPKVKGHWLFQNSMEIKENILGFVQKYRPQYGNYFRADTIAQDICFITDPDGVKHVLQENNRNYTKSFGYEILKMFLGEGLLTSEGDFWRKQRRLAQPAFHKERLAKITKEMAASAEQMSENWEKLSENGKAVNVLHQMNEITLDIVAKSLFGADVGANLEDIRNAITITNEYAMKRIVQLVRLPLWIPTPAIRKYNKAARKLNDIIFGIIEKRRKNQAEHPDLLSMLMAAVDEETNEGMDDQQLRDEAMTIFIAGHETTAIALFWIWYLLAKHPEVEKKLHEELSAVLGDQQPSYEHIPRLKYTRQVIDESMRLYPPAWMVGRRPIKDDVIGGYQVPKGINVLMCTFDIHRHPDYWENPEEFNPERFSEENVKKIKKYAYFPFGGGPRLCIGNNFALMEAQIIVATLAQKFKLKLASEKHPEMEPLITLRPKGEIEMVIEKR